jgi:hypothetical protein
MDGLPQPREAISGAGLRVVASARLRVAAAQAAAVTNTFRPCILVADLLQPLHANVGDFQQDAATLSRQKDRRALAKAA